ncbi:MAG: outer membrane protein TolC, partial [Pirellulaceae bacterium]
EIQSAHAALIAAFERLAKARESKRLAEYMADVERRKFDLGQSNLLSVVLREQYAIEAAEAEVDALLEFYSAKSDYDAAMARDWPE